MIREDHRKQNRITMLLLMMLLVVMTMKGMVVVMIMIIIIDYYCCLCKDFLMYRLLLARHEQRTWSKDTLVRTAALEALKSSVALVSLCLVEKCVSHK